LAQDDLRRHLPAAEAGHAHVAAEIARGGLALALDRLGRDLHLHAHARVAQLGRLGRHTRRHWTSDISGGSLPWVRRRPAAERLQAWIVTGPLGHLWSALADVTI